MYGPKKKEKKFKKEKIKCIGAHPMVSSDAAKISKINQGFKKKQEKKKKE